MIIKVQNGCFAYHGQATILRDINIELKMGRILSVLGPNGIGKTTLLKCMTGLLPWKSGRTLFDDRDIRDIKSKDFWSMVSYIPQARGFSFSYTGLEMVMLGRSAHLGMFEQPGQREIELAQNTMERIGVAHLQKKTAIR